MPAVPAVSAAPAVPVRFPAPGADGVGSLLHTALDGLSLRQSVAADNIANVDTPHFRARSVDFESSLREAVAGGSVPGAGAGTGTGTGTGTGVTVTSTPTGTPVGVNDNNVDLRKETMVAMQSVFSYQLVSRAMSDRLQLMSTAAGQI